jgi:PEP-CTERM motif
MIPNVISQLGLSMKKLSVLFAFAAFCTFSATAQVTIFSDNLNSLSGNTPGYSFGDAVNFSHTYVAGVGVGGSVGARVLSDFGGTNGFGGVAYQYQNGNVTGNSSANLGDYTLSFDAAVNKANGGFALILQNWTGTFFSGTFSQSQYPSEITLATPNVFQHFTINLGTLNPGAAPTGQTWQIAWQMDEFAYGGPGTGYQLIIDNVMVTMVPEPSTVALAVLGAASFGFLRRRKV